MLSYIHISWINEVSSDCKSDDCDILIVLKQTKQSWPSALARYHLLRILLDPVASTRWSRKRRSHLSNPQGLGSLKMLIRNTLKMLKTLWRQTDYKQNLKLEQHLGCIIKIATLMMAWMWCMDLIPIHPQDQV